MQTYTPPQLSKVKLCRVPDYLVQQALRWAVQHGVKLLAIISCGYYWQAPRGSIRFWRWNDAQLHGPRPIGGLIGQVMGEWFPERCDER